MKKLLLLVVIVSMAISTLTLIGCTGQLNEKTKTETKTISLGGSSGGGALLKALQPLFEKAHPNIKLDFAPAGESGDGIEGAYNGTYEVGIVERPPKPEENSKTPVTLWPVAKSPIIFAANSSVNVKNLTTKQIEDIYSGKVTNWSEVGGKNLKVTVLSRNEDDSSAKLIRKEVLGEDLAITDKALVLTSTSQMNDSINSTEGAIGYIALATLNISKAKFAKISYNGIEASEKTINNGTYKFFTQPGVVTKSSSPEEAVKTFIDFLKSDEAVEEMSKYGYVAVK